MSITVYGRRAIRALERETGLRIVHAAGPWLTTIEHNHFCHTGSGWHPVQWSGSLANDVPALACGVPLSSCRVLFGTDETGARRNFMRGACATCAVGPHEPHRRDCGVLGDLLGWPSINPDYWPVPVHRPTWVDRRDHVVTRGGSMSTE